MAEEEFDEFEGEPVLGTRLICRGLEGGLRETVAVSDPAFYAKGERITLVVDAVVDHVAFPNHKPIDEDDDEEGVDRLHVTKLITVAIISRDSVAAQLDAQAQRIAAARDERERTKAEAKERKRIERKKERQAAKEATLFSDDDDEPESCICRVGEGCAGDGYEPRDPRLCRHCAALDGEEPCPADEEDDSDLTEAERKAKEAFAA